ncbi:hypothetical protein GH733_003736 [Mirounga leonina]|nr:hypothetical protein GH733_003736 [Mirounga leonina]
MNYYQCKECGKAYTAFLKLTEHTQAHTGEKPFKCNKHGKAFTTSSRFMNPLRTHNGEKL